jgi:ABC-type Mn2+/Zn2+ transport system ATPase subunit
MLGTNGGRWNGRLSNVASTLPPPAVSRATAPPAVELRGLSVAYGRSTVLSRLTLTVPTGSRLALVGPAGAGKTTLLRCLLGLTPVRAGEVLVLGQAPGRLPEVGYLPQGDPADWRFPLTVGEAALLGRYRRLGPLRRPGPTDRAAVAAALELTGLSGRAGEQVGRLSPSERRRLGLARALAAEPRLLLLDEPLAGLNGESEAELYRLIAGLPERRGLTVLLATRDPSRLRERFERLVLLNGLLIAAGGPDEVLTRANLRAAYGSRTVSVAVPALDFAVDG